MVMKEMKSLFYQRGLVVLDDKIEGYLKFCQEHSYDGSEYSERHHILPQAHFPEFSKEEWNVVNLLYRDHVEAHRLLHEALPEDRSAFFAYFMMKSHNGELSEELRRKNVEMLSGESNPAKRDDVRLKISKAKTGVRRDDMTGKKFFGASEEIIENIKESSSRANKGTVPVRLPNGNVIKVSKQDPRYLSGELKCIIGAKKGQVGPNADPKAKQKFKDSLEKRKEMFASMSGEEITAHCLAQQDLGKKTVEWGKLARNFNRLFGYAGLDSCDFLEVVGDKVQRLSKARPTTKRLI
ncbi:HNH endonuclease [Salmonella phage SeF6a]|nr:HNH endonuclease [Salmonella phage SeF6a]